MKILKASNERIHVFDENSNLNSILADIINSGDHEEAFFINDVGDIVRKHKLFKTHMPRVEPHYAVKCNPSHTVLEAMVAMGMGFDCATRNEIIKVLSYGVDPSKIIFANPAKFSTHIRHAAAHNINLMTFDNESELHKIKKLHPNAKMIIRIKCDAVNAKLCLGKKYGCDDTLDAPHLLNVAKSLGIDVVGVSFHVGTDCKEPSIFKCAIGKARKVFDYAISIGFKMNILDIGGGFPGIKPELEIKDIAKYVNSGLEEFFPDPEIRVIAEPGRYYVTTAFTLAINIHSMNTEVTTDPSSGEEKKHMKYYITDGIYGSLSCIVFDDVIPNPVPFKIYQGTKFYESSIWGPTCDSLDRVVEKCSLPKMEVGDWFIFYNLGAYSMSIASPFNGMTVPKVQIIADTKVWNYLKDKFPYSKTNFDIDTSPKTGIDKDASSIWNGKPITITNFTKPVEVAN